MTIALVFQDAKWEKLPAIPRPSHSPVAVYFEGKIMILDQQEYSTGIFVFHPRENRWSGVPFDGGRQRTAFAVTVAKGGLHVIGGDWMKGTSRDAFTKDIVSLTRMETKPEWQHQHLPPLRNGRADAVAVTIGNRILVIGGIAVELNPMASIEMLDTSSPQRQWVEVGTFPIPSNHLQAAVTEHSVFVGFGNGTENVLYETKISEVENIVATDTARDAIKWKKCCTAPYKNSGLASYDNNLVSVGGWDSLNRPVVSMFAYDPLRRCWDKLCETLEARKRPSIVPISKEKRLFIFGGCLHSGGGEVCTYT